MADHALAIDVGTQSVRAILFDPMGNLVAMGRVPIEPYVSPQPGWAEQDPEVWWTAIGEACRRLWASSSAGGAAAPDPSSVGGVALTTQRVTLVVVRRERCAAATGDRLARPAPDRGPAADRRPVGRSLPPDGRPRHGRALPGRRRGELDRAKRARGLEADPALWRPVVLADRAADRRMGRLIGEPDRLPAVRLQARRSGSDGWTGSGRSRHSSGRGCHGSSPRRGGSAS